jgi:hypothetical protein
MVPLHAQRCADAPDCLRWVTPALPVTGSGVPLAELIADGTLAEVILEPSSVVTRLGAGQTWASVGARVRTALHEALASWPGCVGTASGSAPRPLVSACQRCSFSQCSRRKTDTLAQR